MEWFFRINYIFAALWAFAYATNGSWRMHMAKIAIVGFLGINALSIIVSIFQQSTLFLGVIIESILALFLFTLIFNFLFRNVPKRTDFRSSEQWAKDTMKEILKKK